MQNFRKNINNLTEIFQAISAILGPNDFKEIWAYLGVVNQLREILHGLAGKKQKGLYS